MAAASAQLATLNGSRAKSAPFTPPFYHSTRFPSARSVSGSTIESSSPTNSEPGATDDERRDDDATATNTHYGSPGDVDSEHGVSSRLSELDTTFRTRSNSDDQPQSVIYAPHGVFSEYPPALETTIPGKRDRATPRAQTRQEAEEERERRRRRSRPSSSLEEIAEGEVPFEMETELGDGDDENDDNGVKALNTALVECWTLCNTLASLSSNHRERMFGLAGTRDQGEQAWKSCWRLCRKLYESRKEGSASEVRPTLELCRDFCQALFEARHRVDEATDSVLRVSFELNNHLHNGADRNLPEVFRERTLDFYITLCHRLMKQPTSLPQETAALLHACWSLAEMLFSIRQNTRAGSPLDEELLGSAVQACWDLCNLFREGWSQVRPDRGTPRPDQFTLPASTYNSSSSGGGGRGGSGSGGGGNKSRHKHGVSHMSSQHARTVAGGSGFLQSLPPETPTTIFDDVAGTSPDEVNAPHILVLGPENNTTRTHNRWSPSASALSTYAADSSSQRTSSTARASRRDGRVH